MEAITIEIRADIQLRGPIEEFNPFSLRNLPETCIDEFEMLVRTWETVTVHRQKSKHKYARSEVSQFLYQLSLIRAEGVEIDQRLAGTRLQKS